MSPPVSRAFRLLAGAHHHSGAAAIGARHPHSARSNGSLRSSQHLPRLLSTSLRRRVEARPLQQQESKEPSSKSYDEQIAEQSPGQQRAPWHRQGAEQPPVRRQRSASAMTKGKLLTTPSRLLKLVMPLTTTDHNADRKSIEPLALVVHPQQPLSYLERLIQAELPTITDAKGNEKIPAVYFKAESSSVDEKAPRNASSTDADSEALDGSSGPAGLNIEGLESTYTSQHAPPDRDQPRQAGEDGGVDEANLVRWSASTEIGDFIRDAARGSEFAVVIETSATSSSSVRIAVPSFQERTHFLRHRLRRTSAQISSMATLKQECDAQAQRGARRVAMAGFGLLTGWWVGVWYITFRTDLGWDTMEPVTYLVGLSGLMGGYLWFLKHDREASYRAAMNVTISSRQETLYRARGFDSEKWRELVDRGNALRSEIKAVASEYDVEWDEKEDEHDESVEQALKDEREKKRSKKGKEQDDDDEEDDKRDKKEERKPKDKNKE